MKWWNGFVNFSRTVSVFLGTIPSFLLALLFFLSIFVFAFLYNNLQLHFYHSTITKELSFNNYEHKILNELKKEIIDGFIQAHGVERIPIDDYYYIDINNAIELSELDVQDNNVEMKFIVTNLPLNEDPFTLSYEIIMGFRLNVDGILSANPSIARLHTQLLFQGFPDAQASGGACESLLKIFPDDQERHSGKFCTIFFTRHLLRELYYYQEGQRGFPSRTDDNFERMLYFSFVTITTLGYGDIVPISNLARRLVMLETFLGILLVGLFLNSIAYESRNHQHS